jgi:cold shock CspA family protein
MFKAIRNLVRQRSRDGHQGQPQVIEEDDSREARSDSDVPPRLGEPELEGSSGLAVRAQVKWFNPNKGYGFVRLSDGSGDAFLDVTALAGIGVSTLQPGETLKLRVALGQRGPQVTEVISVDSSTAAPSSPPRKSFRSPSDRQPLEASVQAMGTVKWYNHKGVRIHPPGWCREGCFCACLGASADGHHRFERGPARLCRRSRGSEGNGGRVDPSGLIVHPRRRSTRRSPTVSVPG